MSDLKALSNEQLVESFVELSRQQGVAVAYEKPAKYNQLFRKLTDVKAELRARGEDARRLLIPLLQPPARVRSDYVAAHEPYNIRCNAAIELMALVPDQAKAALKDIAAHAPLNLRPHAGMALVNLEEGTWKPT